MRPNSNSSETDDRGKQFFEQTIQGLRPGSKCSWHEEPTPELHTVIISVSGVRTKLEITEEALDQAVNDSGSHHKLAREVEAQLRVSESSTRIGRVT